MEREMRLMSGGSRGSGCGFGCRSVPIGDTLAAMKRGFSCSAVVMSRFLVHACSLEQALVGAELFPDERRESGRRARRRLGTLLPQELTHVAMAQRLRDLGVEALDHSGWRALRHDHAGPAAAFVAGQR